MAAQMTEEQREAVRLALKVCRDASREAFNILTEVGLNAVLVTTEFPVDQVQTDSLITVSG